MKTRQRNYGLSDILLTLRSKNSVTVSTLEEYVTFGEEIEIGDFNCLLLS